MPRGHESFAFVIDTGIIARLLKMASVKWRRFSNLTIEIQNFMPSVKVRDSEPFEIAVRRFKRTCEKAGVVAEVRAREFYEKPTSVRKRKRAAAVKRNLKRISRDLNRRVRLY